MEPFVFALATLSLADSTSFMIVMPSLAFYINSLGGSQDFYGLVLAIYSFTSFCGKPILGRWSDAYNFQAPYMVSITLSVLGGFMYAIAPAFDSKTALAAVALGRIFGGLGRANSALGFAYVVRACPANKRTSITALLGGVQMIGMAIAPLFSAFLTDVDFTFWGVHFDNLNSVGLLLVIINLASQAAVYFLLPDLPAVEVKDGGDDDEGEKESEWLLMFRCILQNPHIGLPFLTIFAFNFNWQFVETALAPASEDVFDWGPVEVSYVLGVMAVLVFLGMTAVHKLSQSGASDFKLLSSGLIGNTIGYLMIYLLWHRGVHYIVFVIPVFVASGSFPFLGAPNRSLFSEAVDLTPELAGFEGTMQALLSMASSVGGFTAPGVITHFCLRTPEEVSLTNDGREFTQLALFSPLLSLSVLVLSCMAGEPQKEDHGDDILETDDEERPDEITLLAPKRSPGRGRASDRRRRSTDEAERPNKDKTIDGPHKRRSMMEAGRSGSILASLMMPMNLIQSNGNMIYEDE
jgi:MFS family permease